MKNFKLTIHVPGEEISEDFYDMFVHVFYGEDATVGELFDISPIKSYEKFETSIIVQNLAIMMRVANETFSIFEDKTYMVGKEYYENASGRLELEEYIYIHLEEEN